jgi:NTP pyrophosphatase (non-canonical NTP hydrolase)
MDKVMKKCNKCKGKKYHKGDKRLGQIGLVQCNECLPLTIDHFNEVCIARSKADVKHSNDWSPMEWGCALSGEVGELCNYLKKMSRGDNIPKKALAHEVSDIMTYLSLLSDKLDINMEEAIVEKFNIVSKRWGSKYKL